MIFTVNYGSTFDLASLQRRSTTGQQGQCGVDPNLHRPLIRFGHLSINNSNPLHLAACYPRVYMSTGWPQLQ